MLLNQSILSLNQSQISHEVSQVSQISAMSSCSSSSRAGASVCSSNHSTGRNQSVGNFSQFGQHNTGVSPSAARMGEGLPAQNV